MTKQSLRSTFDKQTKSAGIHEAVLFAENSDGSFSENFGYGGRGIDTPMVIASITKMFTTACVLKLCEEGRLSLTDKISRYLTDEIMRGLHVDITVSNLLFQTSGLPDVFDRFAKRIIKDGDRYVLFEEFLAEVKKLPPVFAPNGRKAYYSDMNFDLLGIILEKITGLPLEKIYEEFIFAPLQMKNSYLPADGKDFVPHVYYGERKLALPKFIASCRASGGCVSTPNDLMIFSKAFWSGKLFDKEIFTELSRCKKLQISMRPLYYGGGFMRIPVGGFAFFPATGELLGHSGSSGSLMFYCPEKDLHFVGDFAQFKNPALPVMFAMKLAVMK